MFADRGFLLEDHDCRNRPPHQDGDSGSFCGSCENFRRPDFFTLPDLQSQKLLFQTVFHVLQHFRADLILYDGGDRDEDHREEDHKSHLKA